MPKDDHPANAPTKKAAAEARAAKVEAYKLAQAKAERRRRFLIWGIAGAAIVAIVAVVSSVVIVGSQSSRSDDGASTTLEGLQTFSNKPSHATGPVDYPQSPPVGGPHNPVWLNCGVYDQPVPNENAVHDLEHGAIWASYDPALPSSDVDALIDALPSTYSLISPYEGMSSPIVLSAWNAQLAVDSPDDPRIATFVKKYWQSADAPEPGAPCTGGLDAPGRR